MSSFTTSRFRVAYGKGAWRTPLRARGCSVACLSVIFLAACGGGDDPGSAAAPVPSAPASAPVPSAFNSCYNPLLYATGTRQQLSYSLVGPATGRLDGDTTLAGDAVFNGSVARQRDTVAAYALSVATYVDTTSEYFGTPTPAGVAQFGYVVRSTQNPAAGLTTVTYIPPWHDKTLVLTVGASDTVTYDMSVASMAAPVTATITQTTRFVGIETVTVPAGTFVDACRFEYTTAVNGQAPTVTTTWLSAGSGVLIKGFGPGTNQQLVSGTLNGMNVR